MYLESTLYNFPARLMIVGDSRLIVKPHWKAKLCRTACGASLAPETQESITSANGGLVPVCLRILSCSSSRASCRSFDSLIESAMGTLFSFFATSY